MSRVHADLPENLEPLPDDVRQIFENFGEVAASLPLNHDGGHEESKHISG